LLLATVIAVKLPYFPLALLLLVPCLDGNGLYKERLLAGLRVALLVVAPGIVWLALAMHFAAIPFPLFPAYHPGYLWPGSHDAVFDAPNSAQQIKVFLHRPLYPVVLPVKAIGTFWLALRDQMIGRFGWLEFGIPAQMYPFWVFAVACAIISGFFERSTHPRGPPPMAVILGLVAVAAALCAIFDAAYLAWAPIGVPLIDGVQGRYLLPLLAAFAAFIPAVRVRGAAKLKTVLAIPSFAMAAAGMVVLPTLMVSTYYLR
ncbi:MAG: DUF2142 domain-containing protein, partial [Bryobacteraceae bacterium]